MSYYDKYLKYKNKYLELKKQLGGFKVKEVKAGANSIVINDMKEGTTLEHLETYLKNKNILISSTGQFPRTLNFIINFKDNATAIANVKAVSEALTDYDPSIPNIKVPKVECSFKINDIVYVNGKLKYKTKKGDENEIIFDNVKFIILSISKTDKTCYYTLSDALEKLHINDDTKFLNNIPQSYLRSTNNIALFKKGDFAFLTGKLPVHFDGSDEKYSYTFVNTYVIIDSDPINNDGVFSYKIKKMGEGDKPDEISDNVKESYLHKST